MKTSFVLAALSAFIAVEAQNSTIICTAGCPPAPSVNDIVTRSDVPVPTSCTGAAQLTAVYASGIETKTKVVSPGSTEYPAGGCPGNCPPGSSNGGNNGGSSGNNGGNAGSGGNAGNGGYASASSQVIYVPGETYAPGTGAQPTPGTVIAGAGKQASSMAGAVVVAAAAFYLL